MHIYIYIYHVYIYIYMCISYIIYIYHIHIYIYTYIYIYTSIVYIYIYIYINLVTQKPRVSHTSSFPMKNEQFKDHHLGFSPQTFPSAPPVPFSAEALAPLSRENWEKRPVTEAIIPGMGIMLGCASHLVSGLDLFTSYHIYIYTCIYIYI